MFRYDMTNEKQNSVNWKIQLTVILRIFSTRYGYPIIHHPDKFPAFCRKNRCLYYRSICKFIRFLQKTTIKSSHVRTFSVD